MRLIEIEPAILKSHCTVVSRSPIVPRFKEFASADGGNDSGALGPNEDTMNSIVVSASLVTRNLACRLPTRTSGRLTCRQ